MAPAIGCVAPTPPHPEQITDEVIYGEDDRRDVYAAADPSPHRSSRSRRRQGRRDEWFHHAWEGHAGAFDAVICLTVIVAEHRRPQLVVTLA